VAEELLAALDLGEVASARWFGDKDRGLLGLDLVDALPAGHGALAVADARFLQGPRQRYALPLGDGGLWRGLAELAAAGSSVPGRRGTFALERGSALEELLAGAQDERPLGADQSHTSGVVGERLLVKCFRRLDPGPNPDVELTAYLTEEATFRHTPRYAGSISYLDDDGQVWTLVLLQAFVADGRDGYRAAGEQIDAALAGEATVEEATDDLELLGFVTSELHAALALGLDPRPGTETDLLEWRHAAEVRLAAALAMTEGAAHTELAGLEPMIQAELEALTAVSPPLLTRIHGDYHLGQLLRTPRGMAVVDFEGEPLPVAARRRYDSPLRDVASMLRCLDHAAAWRLHDNGAAGGRERAAQAWAARARERFLAAYAAGLRAANAPVSVDARLLRAFEVEKECYEYVYAQTFLPEWIYAARAGMRSLMSGTLQLAPDA
jgi:trehalose synthase-fused probable maltokinase